MSIDIGSAITLLSVALNFVLGYMQLRPKANDSIVSATTQLLKPLQDRIAFLEEQDKKAQARIEELETAERLHILRSREQERTIERLKGRIDLLIAQLKAAGITPADFTPLARGPGGAEAEVV